MEDCAGAGASAGGAEGGRDHEDASRKCLAPLLSQSNEERRALRSDYVGVRAMIRNGTCKPRFSNLYDNPSGAAWLPRNISYYKDNVSFILSH